jgi:hypothetical protein
MRDRDCIDSEFRLLVLAGRGRTLIGHQNQRPSRAAMEGVMNERTTNVSNIQAQTDGGTHLTDDP